LAGCPDGCPCDSEDHAHLLHCPMEHRVALFEPLLLDLDTLCATHRIDPHLGRVLTMILSPYWGEAIDFAVPAEYEALFTLQQDLHLDSLFLGCFSTEWARLQHKYLKLNKYPRQKGQARNGIKKIATYLLDLVHSAWILRNSALHGDDSTTQLMSYKHTQLLLEIQDLYDQAPHMLAADRSLFTKPYEHWLDKPTTQLQTFLKRMRITVKVSVTQAADMGTHFRTIDTYFPPTIPAHLFDIILGHPPIPPEPD
jgi:hypothetical protein